ISISHFKATCLAVLEQVRRTGRPVLITKRGEPIAEVVPPRASSAGAAWMGRLRGSVVIAGDTVSPAANDADWDVLS
ncbi:MAG: type II toxin-antitoxin system Phd/YefM family antitoxin, partial [Gemmatimonadaceae bacterium]